MERRTPHISVVICTRNRGSQITRAVESVLNNHYPQFDLLIFDQSINDETERALEQFRGDPRLCYFHSSTCGLGLARGLSLELVKSDIVLMTDDDCEVSPSWIAQMAAVHVRYPHAAIVFCDVLPGPYDRAKGFIPVTSAAPDRLITNVWGWCWAGAANIGIGAGLGIRRSLVQAIGGFDAGLGVGTALYCAEETDVALRAILHGYCIYRTTATSVVHHGFRTFEEGRALMRDYMYGIAAMYAKLVRCGYPQLTVVILYELWRTVIAPTFQNLCSLRIPPVLGRIISLVRGFCMGWRLRINRADEVFQPLRDVDRHVVGQRGAKHHEMEPRV